jgi:soluble lytic murein transglycosylase
VTAVQRLARLRQQDPLAYLERIRLAMKAGNTGWSNRWPSRCRQLSDISSAVVALANDPTAS